MNYSIAQINELLAADSRLRARSALTDLAVTQAAVASCMAKNGAAIVNKVRRRLEKQAKGITDNG